MNRTIICLLVAAILTGCAQDAPAPVQTVTIKASDFCDIMRGTLPESAGKPTWDIGDTRRTIDDARKIGAAVDKRCKK